jgi:hypothetical protein
MTYHNAVLIESFHLTDDGEKPVSYYAISEDMCLDDTDRSVYRRAVETGLTVIAGSTMGTIADNVDLVKLSTYGDIYEQDWTPWDERDDRDTLVLIPKAQWEQYCAAMDEARKARARMRSLSGTKFLR